MTLIQSKEGLGFRVRVEYSEDIADSNLNNYNSAGMRVLSLGAGLVAKISTLWRLKEIPEPQDGAGDQRLEGPSPRSWV